MVLEIACRSDCMFDGYCGGGGRRAVGVGVAGGEDLHVGVLAKGNRTIIAIVMIQISDQTKQTCSLFPRKDLYLGTSSALRETDRTHCQIKRSYSPWRNRHLIRTSWHLYCSPAGKQVPLVVQLTGLTGLEGTFGQWCVSAGRGGSSDKAAMHRRRHAASVCVTWIRGRECIPVSRLEWELGYLSEVMPPFG